MRTMSFSTSRRKFAETMDRVTADHEEVVIVRSGDREPVVMMALGDYEALRETAYLLRSPDNARRLLTSIERLESGRGVAGDTTSD